MTDCILGIRYGIGNRSVISMYLYASPCKWRKTAYRCFLTVGKPFLFVCHSCLYQCGKGFALVIIEQCQCMAIHHLIIYGKHLDGHILLGDCISDHRVSDNLNSGIPSKALHAVFLHSSHHHNRKCVFYNLFLIGDDAREMLFPIVLLDNPWFELSMWRQYYPSTFFPRFPHK